MSNHGARLPHAAAPSVGIVSFTNSGAPTAQSDSLTGLARLHNFQYPEEASAFRHAPTNDATCFYALALHGTSHYGREVPTYMKAAALMAKRGRRQLQSGNQQRGTCYLWW